MSDVFVSYKAEDRARVRPLVDALEADGLWVWWDAHIDGGDEWRESIQENLADARCVIVIWSKRSVGPDGSFVRDEATRALRRHVYLPARIDKVEPPLGFGETQALPLIGWKGDRADPRYQAVLGAAQGIVAGKRRFSRAGAAGDGVGRRTLIAGGAAAAAVAGVGVGGWLMLTPGSAAASDSIAVLPFANLSGDPAQAYFSDGIAEELRSALTRIARLKVIGRTSSELQRDADTTTAAQKLDVANILTGSVRKSPTTIRINAQLVNGSTGVERWSQSYDRSPGDALMIQSSIAENVASALSIQLGRAEKAAQTLGGTEHAAAQDFYLQAKALSQVNDDETSTRQIVALCETALEQDANYAAAHTLKAVALAKIAGQFATTPEIVQQEYSRAEASARKAIAIAPTLAEGYILLATFAFQRLDFGGAAAQLKVAEPLIANNADAIRRMALLSADLGRANQSLALSERLVTLEPLSADTFMARSLTLYPARRFEEAIYAARRVLALAPKRLRAHRITGDCLNLLGRFPDASRAYARLDPDDLFRWLGEGFVAARTGDRQGAARAIARLRQKYGESASYQFAQIYAQTGDIDPGFAALHKAVEVRDPGLSGLVIDPFLDPLRRDPRFAMLIRKLNFPDYS